jgi:hypothetical protein
MRLEVGITSSYEVGEEKDYSDMCQMNILNEP